MKWIKNIYYALLVIISTIACTDENLVEYNNEPRVEEGIPMTLNLNFQVEGAMVQSRTAQDINTEYKVTNLYVFAFNEDGTLDAKRLYQLGELTDVQEKQNDNTGITQGTVPDFQMHSGNNKSFYAVANVGYSGLKYADFDKVSSITDLMSITSTLENITSIERMGFIMSGQLMNQGQDKFNVPAGESKISGTLYLYRTDARITFKVKGKAKNASWTNFSFEPRGYRVLNIPQTTYVFSHEEDAQSDYGHMTQLLTFDNLNVTSSDGIYSSFDFYLQENRQNPMKYINDNSWNVEGVDASQSQERGLFVLREEWNGYYEEGDKSQQKKFIFAPQNGTYVEIKGLLSYQDETKNPVEFVSADVTYTIHLGNTGQYNTDINNYATERNTHYTYNVTVRGIDDIVVEVEKDQEKQPGVDGDVVIAGGEVLELDSHFDRYKFYLKKSDLLETSDDKVLTWAISTPFENAMRIKGNSDMPHDYKWITFAVNKEYGVDRDSYVKYPGDDIYDGGQSVTGTYKAPHWTGYGKSSIALRDVEQLLNFLTEEAEKTDSELFESFYDSDKRVYVEDAVVITAFIDEFVYVRNPMDSNDPSTPENPTEEGLLLWKKVVNGRDRMLHICRGAGKTSTDGASSVIRSVLSFQQHPIYTIYDVSQDDLKTAWGTENIMETGRLKASFDHPHASSEPYTNTKDNGRQNQMNFVIDVEKKWTDIISTESRYGLNSAGGPNTIDYNTIWHACMLRNRDINGDNIIQDREVRWYLAAIDQLSDLWIGDDAINETARIYQGDGIERYHVASSTYWDTVSGETAPQKVTKSKNPAVLWSEEGASIGDYGYSSSSGVTSWGGKYAYRCIRNLGIPLNEAEAIPEDYIQWDKVTHTVNLARLGYASKRQASDGARELPSHDEQSANNRPYSKFQLCDEIYSRYEVRGKEVNYSWLQFHNELYPSWGVTSSPCPEGYRVPNQREMAIMLTIPDIVEELDEEKSNTETNNPLGVYITGTAFSRNGTGNYTSGNRYGFLYRPYDKTFILESGESNKGGTRCIRDIQ